MFKIIHVLHYFVLIWWYRYVKAGEIIRFQYPEASPIHTSNTSNNTNVQYSLIWGTPWSLATPDLS